MTRRASQAFDSRYPALAAEFGQLEAATLTPLQIHQGLAKIAGERKWVPATVNRHKAFLSLAYRRGMEEGPVTLNPARLVRQRWEDNGRIRYLAAEEEPKLRAVILEEWPEGTNGTSSNAASQRKTRDSRGMKRTVQVNVKMTEEDFTLLKRAAEKRWPEAVLTDSGIALGLARIAAQQILGKKDGGRP